MDINTTSGSGSQNFPTINKFMTPGRQLGLKRKCSSSDERSVKKLDVTPSGSTICSPLNSSLTMIVKTNSILSTPTATAATKARVFKRKIFQSGGFKSPLKPQWVDPQHIDKEIEQQKNILHDRQAELARMETNLPNKQQHDEEYFTALIIKWRRACQKGLQELMAIIQEQRDKNVNMRFLLQDLNIPSTLVRYSETEDNFF